jgi:AcrR family transcriptional regulator
MTARQDRGAGEVVGGRERLLLAVFDLVLERGYAETTAAALCERAEVSMSLFDEEFGNVQTCVTALYEEITARFDEWVLPAYDRESQWRDGLRAAAYAAADFFASHPREVRFCTVAILSAGELLAAKRDADLQRFVDLIDAGRGELPDPETVGRGVAESSFGAIFERLLREAGRSGHARRARDLVPELMYLAVRPYVGHAEAMEEFSKPPPPPASGPEPLTRNNHELK